MNSKIAIILLAFLICLPARAQGIPAKAEQIAKQTMAIDGHLTQEMHREFWQEMHRVGTPSEIQSMEKSINVSILLALEYQKEFWQSAKISFKNRKIMKTSRLIELESELPIKFGESLPFPKNSPDYQKAISAYKQSAKVSMENSMRMLSAAANRSPMTSVQGQAMAIDMATIDSVLENIDGSFQRLKNLLDESWVE